MGLAGVLPSKEVDRRLAPYLRRIAAYVNRGSSPVIRPFGAVHQGDLVLPVRRLDPGNARVRTPRKPWIHWRRWRFDPCRDAGVTERHRTVRVDFDCVCSYRIRAGREDAVADLDRHVCARGDRLDGQPVVGTQAGDGRTLLKGIQGPRSRDAAIRHRTKWTHRAHCKGRNERGPEQAVPWSRHLPERPCP